MNVGAQKATGNHLQWVVCQIMAISAFLCAAWLGTCSAALLRIGRNRLRPSVTNPAMPPRDTRHDVEEGSPGPGTRR